MFNRIDTLEAFAKRHMLGLNVLIAGLISVIGIGTIINLIVLGNSNSISYLNIIPLFPNEDDEEGKFLVFSFVLFSAVLYTYFACIWDGVFLLYLNKFRTNIAIRRISSGSLRVWSTISLALDGFIALAIFPLAFFLTFFAAIILIFSPFFLILAPF